MKVIDKYGLRALLIQKSIKLDIDINDEEYGLRALLIQKSIKQLYNG